MKKSIPQLPTDPYIAANLLEALKLIPDTGDWYGQLKHWCEMVVGSTGYRPNKTAEEMKQQDQSDAKYWEALYNKVGAAMGAEADKAKKERDEWKEKWEELEIKRANCCLANEQAAKESKNQAQLARWEIEKLEHEQADMNKRLCLAEKETTELKAQLEKSKESLNSYRLSYTKLFQSNRVSRSEMDQARQDRRVLVRSLLDRIHTLEAKGK